MSAPRKTWMHWRGRFMEDRRSTRHAVLELRSALTCRDLEDGSGSQAATSPRVVLARFRFLV